MKVLIDITDDEYKGIVQNNPKNFIPIDYCEVIRNGTPLTGTNGEVLKAVYDVEIRDVINDIIIVTLNGSLKTFSLSWWNANCKGEGESK